ncbi:gliding motility-associated C-terminal domain-containing protein [Arenibacter aquaticus]|uniref:Gliding motility-associated C-terminal domain-containing protein n=1 Tax=Arenibacter aquaticus TaxID=2489054 RepID=A0A3S0AYT2_9FLAO|nr:T9SS type B sorting domain-containing protein [Arenibacter aquaticus]RTE53508.1 gliding motility-associated C-terminal domain-containing protein [Arenibacter aquaticus]
MRAFSCSLCFILLIFSGVSAQNSPDCRSAIPVCADETIMGTADGSGIDDFDPDQVRQTGCLEKGSNISANIENNTSWYVFRAGTDGQVGFDIEALPVSGNTITAEWDFAVYGPDIDCLEIGTAAVEPIRCNYETNNTRYTGVGVNPENGEVGAPFVKQSQNTYDEWLDVKAGEIYYILINNWNTNFDGDPESFMLTFTGSSVDADQDNALDCTLRDEFLGLDIVACEDDPDITLSALNSPFGPDIASATWTVDYDDDGTIDATLPGSGPSGAELVVRSPDSGRYFVELTNSFGNNVGDDILITYFGTPVLQEVIVRDDLSDNNIVEIVVANPDGKYEYALNGGEFQDDPVFNNVPPGLNTVIINDKNGCGTTEPIEFLVVGYPKFFTPNADGIHDRWNVYGISTLTDPVVFIFDRYGKLLKQIDDTTIGWDGTFNGRPMPASDYWFKMDYSQNEGGVIVARSVRSHFSLKR